MVDWRQTRKTTQDHARVRKTRFHVFCMNVFLSCCFEFVQRVTIKLFHAKLNMSVKRVFLSKQLMHVPIAALSRLSTNNLVPTAFRQIFTSSAMLNSTSSPTNSSSKYAFSPRDSLEKQALLDSMVRVDHAGTIYYISSTMS